MSKQELIAIAEAVAGLMPRLARGLTAAEKDPAHDLPLAQLQLCGILSEGPRPMSALSKAMGVSHSALTQIADRLERTRLVKRVAEGNDRRVRCLQLTVKGEKMMRQRRDARVRRAVAVLERLAAPQRETVRASLEILVDACAAVHGAATDRSDPGHVGGNGVGAAPGTANGHSSNMSPAAAAGKRSPSKAALGPDLNPLSLANPNSTVKS